VLQHMDEFMADHQPAHLSAHRPLLQGDRAQPAVFGPVAGIFAGELWRAGDYLNPQPLAFP
jgi:hypothetical protein